MVYSINPNDVIPHLIKGDICVIGGVEYPYLGEFNSKIDVPKNKLGVYYIKPLKSYCLRHMKKDAIDPEQNVRNIVSAALNDRAPVMRERVNKEIFSSSIEPSDNYLKVILKQILNSLQIDLRDYKDKFGDDNRMNNMKRLITNPVNLSYEKFTEWLDILGLTHEITIKNLDGSIFELRG